MALSSIQNNTASVGISPNLGGSNPGVTGPQNPKQILKALMEKLGLVQNQGSAGANGGQCSCGAGAGGGQGGACCGAAQRTQGLGF